MLQLEAFACLYPVPIQERIDSATQITIGKVVQTRSSWDSEGKNIYTTYTILSHSFLKQASPFHYLEIIVPGGVVEDEAQLMSPSIELALYQTYLLFLTPSAISLENTPHNFYPSYELYSYVQGMLPLKNGKFLDYLGGKALDSAALLQYIEKRTSFDPVTPYDTAPPSTPSTPTTDRNYRIASSSRNTLSLTNGAGTATNTFYAGRVEEEHNIIINGTGFGNNIGIIQFANGDNGGQDFVTFPKASDIVSWTDTEIRAKIPVRAGSGMLQVYHENNTLVGEQPIEIEWAIKPTYSTYKNFPSSTRQFVNFIDFNEEGGYTLQYHLPSGLAINEPAKAAFERALETWQCATGVHFTMSESSTNAGAEKDDISAILFQIELPVGVVAMTSSRYKASGSTRCDLVNTTWYLREFDMQFAHPENMIAGLSWIYDTGMAAIDQFDFETIALHELGHAHGLGHINDPNSSMYYAIENGVTKRALSNREIEAGLYQMERSKTENCITSKVPMKEHSIFCGVQFHQKASIQLKAFLEGFYDTETGLMRTDLGTKGLLPVNQPFNKVPFSYEGTEQLTTIPPTMVDWVLLSVRDADNYQTVVCEKAAILLSDGTITNVQEEEAIALDCATVGNYYISITHQNHLSVVSNIPILLDASASFDFTTSITTALGEAQLKSIDQKVFMYSGDFDCNGVINNEDYNLWKINGAAINVYSNADADGNGIINSLDYNLWKTNRSKIGMIGEH